MPDFYWNLGMCFLMGLGVGGMLPIAYALLAETIPARHRGWLMVLVGADVAGRSRWKADGKRSSHRVSSVRRWWFRAWGSPAGWCCSA